MNLQQNLKIISLVAHKATARAVARQQQPPTSDNSQRVVIDFSSPNIAKPFHFGHLKSTILGNFLANLNQYYGSQVIKLNYIGDWGTQYGLLSLGLDTSDLNLADCNDKSGVKRQDSVLERLLEIYIAANKRGEEDENFYRQARERFHMMDCSKDADQLEKWRKIRDISLDELKEAYHQLGIHFDVFEYESDQAKRSHKLIQRMQQLGHLDTTQDGVLVTEVIKNNRPLKVPVLKSDGSSLYLTRDVAAAIGRYETFQFDRMYYVVGANQEKHFHCVREILGRLGHDWSQRLHHVKMGKVKGMSSRSGDAVLLSHILKEARQVYEASTRNVPTSKVSEDVDVEQVGRQLALSALFVYDMRNKRTRDYDFDWNQVMVAGDRSGIHLQTSHARLVSLIGRAKAERGLEPFEAVDEIDYACLSSIEGVYLISVINALARKLEESRRALDPSPLVDHALLLCRATNRARRSDWLHVLREPNDQRARSRLSLFHCAQMQLNFLIKLIGLQPLEQV